MPKRMARIKGKNPGCGDLRLPMDNLLVSTKVMTDSAIKITAVNKFLLFIL
jgi:hypothetical protein